SIRRLRQLRRDAWRQQVTVVYPEPRADFATTVIRLQSSPAPLQQKLVARAQLRLATDENGAPPATETDGDTPEWPLKFLVALERLMGASDFRIWFKHPRMIATEEGWVVLVPTRF